MSNRISVEKKQTIIELKRRGWGIRKISRELGVHRQTVRDALLRNCAVIDSNCTGAPAGSETPTRSQSLCHEHHEHIEEKVLSKLTAQRIYQDLCEEKGFEGSYDSVKRFVRKLKKLEPHRYHRMECDPGEEAQVDFGSGYWLQNESGRLRKANIFRVTLSYSRKGYTEAVPRQNTECFIRALENAFRYFGGVPRRICLDNMRAAVKKADWFEPELNPKVVSFGEHYGCLFMPRKPGIPRHNGKVERSIGYVKSNALKGYRAKSYGELNEHLRKWESNTADTRIHGTTRAQVQKLFEEEKPSLKELPGSLFASFEESQRTVHIDGYVQINKAYYEVPGEYVGHRLWVRWDGRMVRAYDWKMRLIRSFVQLPPGKYSEVLGCEGSRGGIQKSLWYWQSKVSELGCCCKRWSENLVAQRGEQALRVLQGVKSLHKRHTARHIDAACQKALEQGHYKLKELKSHLQGAVEQTVIDFTQEHSVIRSLDNYQRFVEEN